MNLKKSFKSQIPDLIFVFYILNFNSLNLSFFVSVEICLENMDGPITQDVTEIVHLLQLNQRLLTGSVET